MKIQIDPASLEAEAMRQRYLRVDAATVSDVLDALGYLHQGLAAGFAPYPETAGKLAGWAYTICGEMRPYAGNGDPDKMKAVDGLKAGCVSVWSGAGDGICFFGELIALGMKTRGCAGALVDGGIRDIEWIARQKFPVYARYRTPVQSIGRWKVTAAKRMTVKSTPRITSFGLARFDRLIRLSLVSIRRPSGGSSSRSYSK